MWQSKKPIFTLGWFLATFLFVLSAKAVDYLRSFSIKLMYVKAVFYACGTGIVIQKTSWVWKHLSHGLLGCFIMARCSWDVQAKNMGIVDLEYIIQGINQVMKIIFKCPAKTSRDLYQATRIYRKMQRCLIISVTIAKASCNAVAGESNDEIFLSWRNHMDSNIKWLIVWKIRPWDRIVLNILLKMSSGFLGTVLIFMMRLYWSLWQA